MANEINDKILAPHEVKNDVKPIETKHKGETSVFSSKTVPSTIPPVNLFNCFYPEEVYETLNHNMQTSDSIASEIAMVTNIFSGNIERAKDLFTKQLLSDGICADRADFISKLWFSDNTASKVRHDLKEAKKQLNYLNEAKDDFIEYKVRFKQIFDIDYSAKNIKEFKATEELFNELMINIGSQKSFDSKFYLILHSENCNDEYKYEGRGQYGFKRILSATKEEVFEREFNKIATLFGKNGKDILTNLLKKHDLENSSIDEKWKFLRTILLEESKKRKMNAEESYKKLGVSTVEEAKDKFKKAYINAFGNKNNILERVNEYNTSQQIGAGIIQGASIAVAAIAMVASFGAATPVVAAAGTLGIPSSVLVSSATAAVGAGMYSVADDFVSGTKKTLGESNGYGADKTYGDALGDSISEKGITKTVLDMSSGGIYNIDLKKATSSALTSGSLAFVMGEANVLVKNICDVAKMGAASTIATCFVANTGVGIGANRLLSGEITVKGVTYVLIFNIIGSAIQVVGLVKGTQAQLKEARGDLAKLRLNVESDPKLASIADKMQGKPVTIENLDALRREVLLTLGDGSQSGSHINELAKNIIDKIDLIKRNVYFFPEEKFEFKPQRYQLEYKGQTPSTKAVTGMFAAEGTDLSIETDNSTVKPQSTVPKTGATSAAVATDLSVDADSSSTKPHSTVPKTGATSAAVATDLSVDADSSSTKPHSTIARSGASTVAVATDMSVDADTTSSKPKYHTSFIDTTGKPFGATKIQTEVNKLVFGLKNGRIKISELSDNQILDIWSHRLYDGILRDTPEIQNAYIERFNNICKANNITVKPGEFLVRSVPCEVSTVGEINLGKPISGSSESWPAAAAKSTWDGKSDIPAEILKRVIDDKERLISSSGTIESSTIQPSTIFVIDPSGSENLRGFDWSTVGIVEQKIPGQPVPLRNGFGSNVFRKSVSTSGFSTEVDFSSDVRFKLNPNIQPYSRMVQIPGKDISFEVKIIPIIPVN